MTAHEIMRALQCEIDRAAWVDEAFLDCVEVELIKSALALINRQQAEIEQLKSEIVRRHKSSNY